MDLFGHVSGFFITDVIIIEIVAVEVGRLCEPSPVLLPVSKAIAIGVFVSWIAAVESALTHRYESVLIQIGPVSVQCESIGR